MDRHSAHYLRCRIRRSRPIAHRARSQCHRAEVGSGQAVTTHTLYSWGFILAVVVFSSAGDVLLAKAMTSIGDLDDIMAESGFLGAVKAVLTSAWFIGGICAMALAFFSLLTALSWA